jgi:HPr kinase/phosphorylase
VRSRAAESGAGEADSIAGEGDPPLLLHGSVVALACGLTSREDGGVDRAAEPKFRNDAPCLPRGVLITGASGSGKSALALALMALGARLVADDRVLLQPRDGRLIATCPAPLSGLIEARGVGLLRAATLAEADLALIVDLDRHETERLPHPHRQNIAGVSLPCLHKVEQPYFPAAILQYLKAGKVETE